MDALDISLLAVVAVTLFALAGRWAFRRYHVGPRLRHWWRAGRLGNAVYVLRGRGPLVYRMGRVAAAGDIRNARFVSTTLDIVKPGITIADSEFIS
jgi:hypothetical protein